MKETVYIETSVVSYLTARPSRDLVVAAHQQITREWWENVLFERFEPCISEAVIREASRGDPAAVDSRLSALGNLKELPLSDETTRLAEVYCRVLGLPASAGTDAVHLAVSVLNNVDFLVSWNCRHIANGHIIKRIQSENLERGLATPVICTPDELVED
ncbi:MAG: type II toxin-antitoxin system VapC family toxin [Verrucomicrobiota bacterium]